MSLALVSRLTIAGPAQRINYGSTWAFPMPRIGWREVYFIAFLFLCEKNFSIYNVSSLSLWVDDLLYVMLNDMPVINLLNLWMAFESLLRVGAATRQKIYSRIHNCTCIATGYRMSPIKNCTTINTSFTCFTRRAGVFTVAANPIILGPQMSPVEIAFWCLGSNFQNCCTISTSTYM